MRTRRFENEARIQRGRGDARRAMAPIELLVATVVMTLLMGILTSSVALGQGGQENEAGDTDWFLMTSHVDEKAGLLLTVSPDGLTWRAVNNDKSVLKPRGDGWVQVMREQRPEIPLAWLRRAFVFE